MAGGVFKLSQHKVRPGTYVNVINGRPPTAASSPTGIAMIPLIGYDWGPREEWIHLTASSPDAAKTKLGRSIYDDNQAMRMIRMLFMNAVEVYVFITGGGKKATGTITTESGTATATAKYEGALGNDIKIVSVANPLGGFDVSVILSGNEVELFENVKTVADLNASSYVNFAGDGNLTAFASDSLKDGANDEETDNASVSAFLDRAEKIKFNCMVFPTTEESLITALQTKIKYIRNSIGWKCQAVVADSPADHEGFYNLVNSFVYEGKELPKVEAAAWLAGAVAGADYKTSLTYCRVNGATAVVGEKQNEDAISGIKDGETFFTVDDAGKVILEYDINSKVTFLQEDPVDINKGRPCRVYDTFANDLLLTFIPGKFDNDPDGWKVMEGLGRSMLKAYLADGAIKNVDLEADFKVDQEKSIGDEVYFLVGIQPVDSVAKYYFTVVSK